MGYKLNNKKHKNTEGKDAYDNWDKDVLKQALEDNAQDERDNIEVVAASPAIEPQYTAELNANGTTQYRKDGKLISKAEYEQAN